MNLVSEAVQTTTASVDVLKSLQRDAGVNKRLIEQLREDLHLLRRSIPEMVRLKAEELNAELSLKIHANIAGYRHLMKEDVARVRMAFEEELEAGTSAVAVAKDRSFAEKTKEAEAELKQSQKDYETSLAEWQRQCFYYKHELEEAKAQIAYLKTTLSRNKVQFKELVPIKAMQVHNEAKLIEDLQEATEAQEKLKRVAEKEQLQRKRAEFLFRSYKVQVASKMEETRRTIEQLERDKQALIAEMKETEALASAEGDGKAALLRSQIEANVRQRMEDNFEREMEAVTKRHEAEKLSLMDAQEAELARVNKAHQSELREVQASLQQLVAQKTADHKTEIAEVTKVWKEKLKITEKSLENINSKRAMDALAVRQAKLLELALQREQARKSQSPTTVADSS